MFEYPPQDNISISPAHNMTKNDPISAAVSFQILFKIKNVDNTINAEKNAITIEWQT